MLVDASVALKWFVPEADSETAVALLTDNQLSAPDLILVEVGNALWKALRRGALDGVTFGEDVERLHEAFAFLHPLPELTIRAAGIARELGHPVYDCVYLACAERRREELVTADLRLLQKVQGSKYEALCRPL